jgi:hypothetical protein
MKKLVSVILLLVLVAAFVGAQETHYAYKILQIAPADLQRTLDSYGADGFHVISITWMQTYFFVVLEHPY